MNIMAGSLGGRFPTTSLTRLEVVSVVINDTCNLRCRHCYLRTRPQDPLRAWEWRRFLASLLADLAPSVLCFAGKEPLLDRESVRLWSGVISLRDRLQAHADRRTCIGLITNGTLVLGHRDSLLASPPDYIDISIDGLPETHDRIRGSGSFQSLDPGLRWLTANLPECVWVTHTLFGTNIQELPRLVQFLHNSYGLRRFSLGFYRPLPYTDLSLVLSPGLAGLEGAFERLGSISLSAPIEIVVELGFDQKAEASVFQRIGWIPPEAPFSSQVLRLADGLSLRINASSVPTGLWRAVRISSEGHWLAAEDLVNAPHYAHRAVTTVRQCGYDAKRAYEIGLRHRRLSRLVGTNSDMVADLDRAHPQLENSVPGVAAT